MTRQTSIEAYHYLVDNGALAPARRDVYAALYKHGPASGSELFRRLPIGGVRPLQASILSRLGELRQAGLVYELEPRPCAVTSMTVIIWDVTDRVHPKQLKPRGPSREKQFHNLLLEIIEWMDLEGHAGAAVAARETVLQIKGEAP